MSRYFQPEIECASREEIRKIQSERLVKQVRNVWDNVPMYRKKMEKKGISPDKINQQARMNVKNIQTTPQKQGTTVEEKAAKVKKSTEYYQNTNYKPGSLAAKANMVKQFDEKNKKK